MHRGGRRGRQFVQQGFHDARLRQGQDGVGRPVRHPQDQRPQQGVDVQDQRFGRQSRISLHVEIQAAIGELAMHGRTVRAAGGQPCGLQRRQLPHAVRQEQRDAAFRLIKQLGAAMRMPVRGVGAGIDRQPHDGTQGAIGIQHGFRRVMRHVGYAMFYGETS
ncbi:hypothetical protein D3C72_1735010 [compost metagenome]